MASLGTVGIANKGDYSATATYANGNFVYYEGSSWLALKDNLTGVTPEEGENWKYLARGFATELLTAITALDATGVLGAAGASVGAQSLIDAIADRVMTKLLAKEKLVNNLLATDPTTALSGPMGKALDDKIVQIDKALPHKAPALLEITKTDPSTCNLLFYNIGNGNWAGVGCNNGGQIMARAGLSDDTARLYPLNNAEYPITDLSPDDLWTDGNYYVRNSNTPFNNHGFLRVYSSGDLHVQEFIPFDKSAGSYAIRHKNYNVATDWVYLVSRDDLTDKGIVTPLSGQGTYNDDWVTSHLDCVYRIVNGICFVRFDMGIKPITTDNTVLVRGLPISTFPPIYQCAGWTTPTVGAPLQVDTQGNITALKCPGGYFAGQITYPVK